MSRDHINDWAVVTPDGHFAASPAGMKLIHGVTGVEFVDGDQIKRRFYTPGLLQKVLGR